MRKSLIIFTALIGCVVTMVWASPAKVSKRDYLPVLFVHGHGLYPEDWSYFQSYFRKHSYPEDYLYALKIEPNTQPNLTAAREHIAPAIDKLLKKTGSKRVNIIAHSMGAVSSRWYAGRIAPEKVNAWISIAGSNHGTNALCKFTDPSAREMCPAYSSDPVKNAIQTELNGKYPEKKDETPYGFGKDDNAVQSILPTANSGIYYWTIRIAEDEWIEPSDSATLDGAGGLELGYKLPTELTATSPGNFLFEKRGMFTKRPDHDSLLRNKIVADFVLKLILHANEAANLTP